MSTNQFGEFVRQQARAGNADAQQLTDYVRSDSSLIEDVRRAVFGALSSGAIIVERCDGLLDSLDAMQERFTNQAEAAT